MEGRENVIGDTAAGVGSSGPIGGPVREECGLKDQERRRHATTDKEGPNEAVVKKKIGR